MSAAPRRSATAGSAGLEVGLVVGPVVARLLLALALSLAGAVVVATPAAACSCAITTTRTALARSDAAFRGTVTSAKSRRAGGIRWVDYRFDVRTVYKGTVYADQVVASAADPAACGLAPKVLSQWVIFATLEVVGDGPGAVTRLRTTLCSGNLPAGPVPAALGEGREPRPGASDREERAADTDQALDRALAITGVTLLVAGGLLAAWIGWAWRPRRLGA